MKILRLAVLAIVVELAGSIGLETAAVAFAQQPKQTGPELALLDTDIGDDIDDAFALALILRSPEIKLLGITTAFGDTELRARLTDRYLDAARTQGIPVAVGRKTPQPNVFSQAAYARQEPDHAHPDAVTFLLQQINAHPGQITLIAIGPLVNVGDAIKKDPGTFRKLKRVVMMGGSVYRGYGENRPPEPEWNIARDPEGAKALMGAGVPIFMMPLDSTQIQLGTAERERIFSAGLPVTDQLTLLYHQWLGNADNHPTMPTLFDPVAAAYAIRPELCPMKALRIEVDDKGLTRPVDGPSNAQVCVKSDEKGFLDFLIGRVTSPGR